MKNKIEVKISPSFGNQVLFFGLVQAVLKFKMLIVLPILSRIIGTVGYGVISVSGAFIGIIQMLLPFGANTSMTIFIPWCKNREEKSKEFWSITQLVVTTAFIATIALFIFRKVILALFFPVGFSETYFLLSIFTIPFVISNFMLYAEIINNHQAKPYLFSMTVANVVEFILILAGAYFFKITGVLLALLMGQILLMALTFIVVTRVDSLDYFRSANFSGMKKYYTYGFVMLISDFAVWVIGTSSRFIIGKYYDLTEVGIYHVSYALCWYISSLAEPFFTPLLPFVTSAISVGDKDSAKRSLERTFRLLIIIFAPVVVFMSLESREILFSFTTSQFERGRIIIPFIAFSTALYMLSGIYTYCLHSHKKGKFIIVSMVIPAIVNLILNIIFIPHFGIVAAAASTLIAYAIHFIIVRYFADRFLPIVINRIFLLKIIAAILAMSGAILLIGILFNSLYIRFIFAAVASFSLYATIIFVTGVITKEERQRAWETFRSALVRK